MTNHITIIGSIFPLNHPYFSLLFSSSTLYRIQFQPEFCVDRPYLNYISMAYPSLIFGEGIKMGPSNHEVELASEGVREGENLSFATKLFSLLSSFFLFSKLDGQWAENQRGYLMIVATVLMTVSFQGVPAMATYTGEGFIYIMTLLTICFSSSIAVAFILVSGLPMTNKICLSILSLGLSISLYTLSLAFAGFMYKITPESVYATTSYGFVLAPLYLLVALITGIFVYSMIRALAWIVYSCQKDF